ncbi:MAG: ATP-binding protein [Firmicutes bacterium]|nr:ATP-binding protein [Bacillota bacterium]
MLVQFSVENFRSIKDKATLDMRALDGRTIKEHRDSLIDKHLLPVAAIYGPNGGGKTTLLHAFNTMKWVVTRMWMLGVDGAMFAPNGFLQESPIIPFAFDKECKNKATKFEIVIEVNNGQYKYGMDVSHYVIEKEYLYKKNNNDSEFECVFERGKNVSIQCDDIKGVITERMAEKVASNMPMLIFINQFYNVSPIKDIVHWMQSSMFIDYNGDGQERLLQEYILQNDKDKKLKANIVEMLQIFGSKVSDYEIKELNKQEIKTPLWVDTQRQVSFETIHTISGTNHRLPFQMESMGTRKIIGLIPWLHISLQKGTPLFVDELDSKLHPKLLEQIIRLYTNPQTNTGGGQLIFTSHDMTTMKSENFRRDEIYFMCLSEEQDSELYSLVEIKEPDGKTTRKDGNFAKRYLEGRYGADPYFETICGWGGKSE